MLFIPFCSRRVCAPDVSTSLALRYPRDPRPPVPTPGQFQCPSKLIGHVTTVQIRGPFTYSMSFEIQSHILVRSRRFHRKVTPQERKVIQPRKLHPLDFCLPHITRRGRY